MKPNVVATSLSALALTGCIKLGWEEPMPSLNDLGAYMASSFSPLPPVTDSEVTATAIPLENSQPKAQPVAKKLVEDLLQYYDPKQPRQALLNFLGTPSDSEPGRDVWEIADTSDGVIAPTRLIVNYDAQGNSYSWYKFGGLGAILEFDRVELI